MSITLKVLFENEDLLAIDKEAGMVVNKSQTVKGEVTVQDLVSSRIDFSDVDDDSEFKKRGGIVHRLDRETSGVLLIAKNEDYFYFLQNVFKERDMKKEYLVVCVGSVEEERFEIDAPIGRDPKNRFKFAIVRDAKEASTFFEKIKETTLGESTFTTLKAYPRTGRTHQIRVHLTAYGFPIAGDMVYSTNRLKLVYEDLMIDRMLLHASSLEFKDKNGDILSISSETPPEFQPFL